MTWRALRPIVLPILRDVAGDAARLFLSPCCRLMFWQFAAIRRRIKGKRARFAMWRYRVLLARCHALEDERCSAAQAADRVLRRLLADRHEIVRAILEADSEQRRRILELLGPEARSELLGRLH